MLLELIAAVYHCDSEAQSAGMAKVASTFRMVVPAGKATPQPPVGSALGQRGLKLMDFCKKFNDQTAIYKPDVPIQVQVTAYVDRTFDFVTKGPSSSYYLLQAAGLEKGANSPGHETVGQLSVKHIYEIAKVKHEQVPHMAKLSLESISRSLVGSCRSMGIKVTNPREQ